MELSIVLPCAANDGIQRCLDSIDEDVEIITVLNGAAPGVREIVAGAGAKVVELPVRNLGAACQAGCAAASAPHILLMNTDAVFEPGAIGKLLAEWRPGTVVRATLVFDGESLSSRVVQNLQTHQASEPDKAYQPGLLFHRDVVHDIGDYYFDEQIYWTEDADFDRRLRRAGISVVVSDAVVRHGAVSVPRKLRSAFRYGIGRAIAEERRLHGTHPPFTVSMAAMRREWTVLTHRYGPATGVYGSVWYVAFALGVLAQRHLNVYRFRRRRWGRAA